MHDPQTMAHQIKFPWVTSVMTFKDGTKSRHWANFITIWHVDPEKHGTGNRSDDSCGWFDRTPGVYTDAVAYLLKDKSFMHDVRLTLERRESVPYPFYEGISEQQNYGLRLPAGDALALVLMVASELEARRWWNGQRGKEGACRNWLRKTFTRRRKVAELATSLALNSTDNLSSVEDPEAVLRLTAAALNRHFRPWYKHPRWHFWHWKFQIHPLQTLRRKLFERCAHCKKSYKWGYCPTSYGGKETYHFDCIGLHEASQRNVAMDAAGPCTHHAVH